MNFSAVAGTAGLVSNAISALKNARELAKDSSNNELNERINDAYGALLDLREHALAQDDEIRELKSQIAAKAAYVGPVPPHGYYYAAGDDLKEHPLCHKCYQLVPPKMGFFDAPQSWNGGVRRDCKLCGHTVYEKPMDLSPRRVVRRHSPYT